LSVQVGDGLTSNHRLRKLLDFDSLRPDPRAICYPPLTAAMVDDTKTRSHYPHDDFNASILPVACRWMAEAKTARTRTSVIARR